MTNIPGKKTIGLLVGGIVDHFTEDLCRGVMHAISKDNNINLVVFPGKYIYRDYSQNPDYKYEYQYNTLFAYPKPENIDGIIVAIGSIGCLTTKENNTNFLNQFQNIPKVIVAGQYDDCICVNYDCENGIREAMEYLIEKINCTKICMVGGSDDNYDAYMRKQVYLKILKEYGIPFEDRFYVEGNLSETSIDVFNELLDRNPDAEAVFCVNDIVALGLYSVMKERGIMPGKDIKVFGYDNEIISARAEPSLSSIGVHSDTLGMKATELLKKMLKGETVHSEFVPTRFIARNSFGSSVSKNINISLKIVSMEKINEQFDEIFYRYRSDGEDRRKVDLRRCFYEIVSRIIGCVNDRYLDEIQFNEINNLIDVFFQNHAMNYTDADYLVLCLNRFHQSLLNEVNQKQYQNQLDKFFDKIRENIIHAVNNSHTELKKHYEREKDSMKVFAGKSINFKHGSQQDFVSLFRNIGLLGVKNAYMYLYDEPIIHMINEFFYAPDHINLKAICRDGEVFGVPEARQRRNISEIFSGVDISHTSRNMTLLPIFYQEYLYGVILCDLNSSLFENGEFISSQLGASVRILYLLKSNDELVQSIETSLLKEKLKTSKINSDILDEMTGAYNRKGYFSLAEAVCQSRDYDNSNIIVGYVTMNHLRIINSRFGHDEGDNAIKCMTEIIKEFLGNDGIVGRIGGDEFALVYRCNVPVNEVKKNILESFKKFNKSSDKPYNILVSIGLCKIAYGIGRTLKEALALASEELYIDKCFKDIYLLKEN